MEMPSDRKAKTRVRIAFLFLFVFVMVFSVGAYFVPDMGDLRESIAAREGQRALQGITDPRQLDEALRQHPSNRFLQLIAMATRAADETNAGIEKLSAEVEPPAVSRINNLGTASRSDLETLRRGLKTAEANATTFMPRYSALLKTERDNSEKYALSLQAGKDTVSRLLKNIDKRHAETAALTSRVLAARADFYRAYETYVAVLTGEFGDYRVVDGQFIFTLQRTVDRYNVAASAMTAASNRVAESEQTRKALLKSQQEGWKQSVDGID
jgi:hypothetical protein